jgi:hypothetical protein
MKSFSRAQGAKRHGDLWFKPASPQEAYWTKLLGGMLFVGYEDGLLATKHVEGNSLDWECEWKTWEAAVGELSRLRRDAQDSLHTLPQERPWTEILCDVRSHVREVHATHDVDCVLVAASESLPNILDSVPRFSCFLDANPSNWIVTAVGPVKIDYGHVCRAHPFSDLCQLLEWEPSPFSLEESVERWKDIDLLSGLTQTQVSALRMASALSRLPYHPLAIGGRWLRLVAKLASCMELNELACLAERACKTHTLPANLNGSKWRQA